MASPFLLESLLQPEKPEEMSSDRRVLQALLSGQMGPNPAPSNEGSLDSLATMGSRGGGKGGGSLQDMVRRMAARKYGWRGGEWDALQELVQRESSWNPKADNPTSSAYGLFQFLDSTRENYGIGLNAGPRKQAKAGLKYILDRYGDPTDALAFHDRMNWY